MSPFVRHCASALLSLGLLAAPGCDRLFDKGSKDSIAAAEKKAAAGDFRGAVRCYEASLDDSPKSAETHYKLALLYTEKLGSPLDCIHHLNRYLELAPGGPRAKAALGLKKDDTNRLRNELNNGAPGNQADASRLRETNGKLLLEIQKLHDQISDLEKKPATVPGPAAKGEPERKPIPPGARTYIVKPGDTFAKISRQFYNTPARARKIQDANFVQVSGTVKIKPGMKLAIP